MEISLVMQAFQYFAKIDGNLKKKKCLKYIAIEKGFNFMSRRDNSQYVGGNSNYGNIK